MNQQDELQTFKLGVWHVDMLNHQLVGEDSQQHSMRPKVLQVLRYLARNFEDTVTREELVESVWDGNHYIGDRGLTDAIWQLRKVLDCDPKYAPYIETIPKSGYRLNIRPELDGIQTKKLNKLQWPLWSVPALMLILFAVFVFQFLPKAPIEVPDYASATPRSLTNLSGHETSPKLSPDGRFLAFVQVFSTTDLAVFVSEIDNKNAEPIRISEEGYMAAYPQWSADSKELLFITSQDRLNCEIKKISLISRSVAKISDCYRDLMTGLAWSPDGNSVAYVDKLDEQASHGIVIYETTTNSKRQITYSSDNKSVPTNLSWSSDGKNIVYVRAKGVANGDLFVVDLDGNEEQITQRQSSIMGFTWAEDDEHIIFSERVSNRALLHKVNLNSKEVRALPLAVTHAAFPTYSRATRTLAFSRRNFNTGLYVLDNSRPLENSPIIPLFKSPDTDQYPNYSAVHNLITFISDRSGHDEVWVASDSGQNLRQITDLKTQIYSPAWSPDGRYIAFTAASKAHDNFKQLFVYDFTRQKLEQLTSKEVDHAPPTWAKDSQSLYTGVTAEQGFKLWEVQLSGESRLLIEEASVYALPAFDGTGLYFTKMRENGIWKYDFESQQTSLFIEDNGRFDGSNWLVAENGIYYVSRKDDQDSIMFYEYSNGFHTQLVTLPSNTISAFQTLALLPDKNQLVFVQNYRNMADIYAVSYP